MANMFYESVFVIDEEHRTRPKVPVNSKLKLYKSLEKRMNDEINRKDSEYFKNHPESKGGPEPDYDGRDDLIDKYRKFSKTRYDEEVKHKSNLMKKLQGKK